MKVIIAGSRNILKTMADWEWVERCAFEDSGFDITEVVSGGARGVDTAAIHYGNMHRLPIRTFYADWGQFGKSAGYMRNKEMGRYADAAVICWDGKSIVTKHMINIMKKLKKPYKIYIR